MKSLVTSSLVALLLIVSGAVFWTIGRTERDLAALRASLATMKFDAAAERASESPAGFIVVRGAAQNDASTDRATAEYWLKHYDRMSDGRGVQAGGAQTPQRLLLEANAAYRTTEMESTERSVALAHLESVIKSYAEALKTNPDNADAAYNYEFVVRERNTLAKAASPLKPAAPESPATIHGKPGAPPKGVNLAGFRILIPQRSDERDKGPEAGKGGPKQRKG